MQKRIVFLVVLSILIMLTSLGLISSLRVHESIKKSYEDRLAVANIIATSVEHILEENLTRLYDISLSDKIDFRDHDWDPERGALKDAYEYSIFKDGLFLLDRYGNVVLTYPHRESGMVNALSIPAVSAVISERKPVISSVYTMEPTGRKVIFVLVPLKNKDGEMVGAAGGEIDPTNYVLTRLFKSIPVGKNTGIELVDGHGMVIASNNPSSILTCTDHNRFLSTLIASKKSSIGRCHRCHGEGNAAQEKTNDILAFAPLSLAPWGVSVREPEEIVFSPSTSLKKAFLLLGLISLVAASVLAVGMSKSIVKPIRTLIRATQRIGKGNLAEPVDIPSSDEIGTLALSFDDMRQKLAASLASIQQQNLELERRVRERTRQLEEKQLANKTLLKKVITSQEDERKRVAREIHDESLQALSALLMNIEMCRLHPELITPEKVALMKDVVMKIINEMNKLVQNLRPTVLDDLGFEAAISWLLDRNLKDRGINCSLNMEGFSDKKLTPDLEITLFRIIQEASMNIARHSRAKNAFVCIRVDEKTFSMSIEDDGDGFDTATVLKNTLTGRGLGILGMKERAAHLNGNLTVCSAPGGGTIVLCKIPFTSEV